MRSVSETVTAHQPTERRHAEVTAEFVARRLLHQMDVTIFCTSVAADPRCPDCGRDRALRGHRDPGVDGSRGTDVGSRAKLAPDEKRCAACCCVSAGE